MKTCQISTRRKISLFIDIMFTDFFEDYNQMCDIFFNKLIKLNTFVSQLDRQRYIETNKNRFLSVDLENVIMFKHPTKRKLFCVRTDNDCYSTDLYVYNIISNNYDLSLKGKMFDNYRPKKTTIYKFYAYVLNQDVLNYMSYINEYFGNGQIKLENKNINIED